VKGVFVRKNRKVEWESSYARPRRWETSNVERRTFNVQRSTFNVQRSMAQARKRSQSQIANDR
jgi:hypothetical protein